MDTRHKTPLKWLGFLLLPFLLLFGSCENEKFDVVEPSPGLAEKGTLIEHLTYDEVPDVIDAITDLTGKSSSKKDSGSRTVQFNGSRIDISSVLKVRNEDGITNYTFTIDVAGAPIGEFYNLIVNQDQNGVLKTPYILKYMVSDDAIRDFIANNADFRYFKGKRYRIPFDRFFGTSTGAGRVNEDCPDGGTPINNTGGGGSGDFFDIDKYNYIQTDPNYYQYADYLGMPQSYALYLNSFNTSTQLPTSYWGQVQDQLVPISTPQSAGLTVISIPNGIVAGTVTMPSTTIVGVAIDQYTQTGPLDGGGGIESPSCRITVTIVYSDGTTTVYELVCDGSDQLRTSGTATDPADCPDGGTEGEVGVVVSKEMSLFNNFISDLAPEEQGWIKDAANGDSYLAIFVFLKENGFSDENEAFAKEVIDALMNAGEVDFKNSVILDSTFMNIDKAKCTYAIISQNSNFKEIIENFTGEETPNLTFKIVPNLDCSSDGDIDEGCTSSSLNSNNSITISIDEGYVNSSQTPTLMIAQTIIHEVIHANLYLALYNLQNGNPINLPDINDFPAIYEQYRQYTNRQHEIMAGEYTGLIAQILQEIHPLLNDQPFIDSLADYSMTLEEFYTNLGYVGLNGTLGQTNFLNDPTNATNYNLSFYGTQANSTKTPNCN